MQVITLIGFAIILVLIVTYFGITPEVTKTYGQSGEKTIHLHSIQTPEQEAYIEKIKEQWLADFNQLLNESPQFSQETLPEN